ncbi:hypothetical protein EVAR_37055_1 [Eumeta japonica]|uniref:Uncharacterized protein n=1 Tax=Eumeta variegata TaxID=151549 RepID=A0A4C1WGK4_EUMVA|nr:hypothetical protein EVAR_37055_1 [Eumeta japonica]
MAGISRELGQNSQMADLKEYRPNKGRARYANPTPQIHTASVGALVRRPSSILLAFHTALVRTSGRSKHRGIHVAQFMRASLENAVSPVMFDKQRPSVPRRCACAFKAGVCLFARLRPAHRKDVLRLSCV